MADSTIPYDDPTSIDRSLASQQIARAGGVGGNAEREEVCIGNSTDNAGLAVVMNTNPVGTEYGLGVRPIGTSLSDGMGSQTVPGVAAYNMFFNGSSYDRASLTRPFPTQQVPLATYMTSFSAVAAIGTAVEIIGSATKTVKVWEIFIEKPTVATTVLVRKHSSASTGGSSTNQTIVPCEDLDGAATAVVKAFTAAPTAGTLLGNVWTTQMTTTDREDVLFGGGKTKPITLRGTSQTLTVNTSVAGANTFTIVFTEETPTT